MISDERFRKYEHILKARDFRKTYKKGAYFKKDAIVLYVLPNNLDNSRIGFSISSRYLKLASARNRLRRRLREIYRKKKRFLRPGFDIIFIAGKGAAKIDRYQELDSIVCALLKKAEILV